MKKVKKYKPNPTKPRNRHCNYTHSQHREDPALPSQQTRENYFGLPPTLATALTKRSRQPYQHDPDEIRSRISQRIREEVIRLTKTQPDKKRVTYLVETRQGNHYQVSVRGNHSKILSIKKLNPSQ